MHILTLRPWCKDVSSLMSHLGMHGKNIMHIQKVIEVAYIKYEICNCLVFGVFEPGNIQYVELIIIMN